MKKTRTVQGPPVPPGFYEQLGLFHGVWQSIDILLDQALAHFRGQTFAQGLEFVTADVEAQS